MAPWKVVFHAGEPTEGMVLTAHTTEGAAQSSLGRLEGRWAQYQTQHERPRWTWAVIHDPTGSLPAGRERKEAEAAVWGRIYVRPPKDPVTYQRRAHSRRPRLVEVHRIEGSLPPEALHRRWQRSLESFEPYDNAARPGLGRHPYALLYLLQDACGLAYISTSQTARTHKVVEAGEAFATEVLDPLGDTWTLELGAILTWLEASGLIRAITEPGPS